MSYTYPYAKSTFEMLNIKCSSVCLFSTALHKLSGSTSDTPLESSPSIGWSIGSPKYCRINPHHLYRLTTMQSRPMVMIIIPKKWCQPTIDN